MLGVGRSAFASSLPPSPEGSSPIRRSMLGVGRSMFASFLRSQTGEGR
jgi:hypothetical protein